MLRHARSAESPSSLFQIQSVEVAHACFLCNDVFGVNDKTTDIAILKTLGVSPSQVMRIFMIQGMISGLIGLILGLTCGVALTLNFEAFLRAFHLFVLPPGQRLPILFDQAQFIWITLGTLLTIVVTTLYPAARAASIFPAEALRYE